MFCEISSNIWNYSEDSKWSENLFSRESSKKSHTKTVQTLIRKQCYHKGDLTVQNNNIHFKRDSNHIAGAAPRGIINSGNDSESFVFAQLRRSARQSSACKRIDSRAH